MEFSKAVDALGRRDPELDRAIDTFQEKPVVA